MVCHCMDPCICANLDSKAVIVPDLGWNPKKNTEAYVTTKYIQKIIFQIKNIVYLNCPDPPTHSYLPDLGRYWTRTMRVME